MVTIGIQINVLQSLSESGFDSRCYYLLFMVIDPIILYSCDIVMTDIYIYIFMHTKFALYFMDN